MQRFNKDKFEPKLIFPQYQEWLDREEQNQIDYANRTRKALLKAEYVLSHLKECKRCSAQFYTPTKRREYCLECRDARYIYTVAQYKVYSINKYYLTKLGYIPQEKQEVLDFLLDIITKWRDSLMDSPKQNES